MASNHVHTALSTAMVSILSVRRSSCNLADNLVECSYDQPSNRRRNPPPMFLETMDKKVRRAESILQLCFPGVLLDDPRFDALLQQSNAPVPDLQSVLAQFHSRDSSAATSAPHREPDSDLESMITSKGALDQNENGEYNYFGASSGFNFLRRMSEEFGELVSPKRENDSLPASRGSKDKTNRMSSVIMNLPGRPKLDSPSEHGSSIGDLPSRDKARRLVQYALDDACAIIPCVHQPSFFSSFHRIYNLDFEEYNTQDHRFLPLLYVVMALGCLFAKDEDSELERRGYISATDEGFVAPTWRPRQLTDAETGINTFGLPVN